MGWTTVKTVIRGGIVVLGAVIITVLGLFGGWIMNQSRLPPLGGGVACYVTCVVFLWVFIAVTTLPWLRLRRPTGLSRGPRLGPDGNAAGHADGSEAMVRSEGEGRETE